MNAFWRKPSILFATALALLAGCSERDADAARAPALSANRAAAPASFAASVGGKTVSLELAAQPLERARGLMFRERLGENEGMLFLFETPARQSFWMKHTQIPLDLAFLTADGVVREVKPLYPFVTESVDSLRDDIAFCLEMPQGWFAKNGVAAGARLDLNAVRDALKARGLSPKTFGL